MKETERQGKDEGEVSSMSLNECGLQCLLGPLLMSSPNSSFSDSLFTLFIYAIILSKIHGEMSVFVLFCTQQQSYS